MSPPAVPRYVTDAAGEFDGCPPGHRFNLYFPIWRDDWQLDKTGKAAALRKCLKLGDAAEPLEALLARQRTYADALPEDRCHIIEGRSTSPFATGLGLEHPVENGFAFLSPYGLPYLAGSGVKGVLRRAAEELELDGELAPGTAKHLFGPDTEDIRKPEDARRGAVACWDVFPQPRGGELVVEIMTPHFSHYYQPEKGKEHLATPHDAGKPNPIPFLAVPAGSAFRFVVTCEPALLGTDIPDWKTALDTIVNRAFDWLGFGAKTTVGYGAMEEDPRAKEARQRQQQHKAQEAQRLAEETARRMELENMDPISRSIREFLDARQDKNQPEISALLGGLVKGRWDGEDKIAVALHTRQLMKSAKKWKEKSEKKNPAKDNDYQDTLRLLQWLAGR